jgi:hypothetical protein
VHNAWYQIGGLAELVALLRLQTLVRVSVLSIVSDLHHHKYETLLNQPAGSSVSHFLGQSHLTNEAAALPFLSRDPKAIEIVQVILESVLLRREKHMKDKDGRPIVNLPPKTVSAPYATNLIFMRDRLRWKHWSFLLWSGKSMIKSITTLNRHSRLWTPKGPSGRIGILSLLCL